MSPARQPVTARVPVSVYICINDWEQVMPLFMASINLRLWRELAGYRGQGGLYIRDPKIKPRAAAYPRFILALRRPDIR
jgi:hypothetical protein